MFKFKDFDSDNILINEKSYKNILSYDVLYKTLIGSKPLQIRFNKIDVFIRIYDGTRYLVLFGPENYGAGYNRSSLNIVNLISQESGVTYVFSYYYVKIKLDS